MPRKAGKKVTRDKPDVTLSVPVKVKDRALYMRMDMATGTATIGGVDHNVECAIDVSGAGVIVQVSRPRKPGEETFWRSFVFPTRALIDAAVAEYTANPPTAEDIKR